MRTVRRPAARGLAAAAWTIYQASGTYHCMRSCFQSLNTNAATWAPAAPSCAQRPLSNFVGTSGNDGDQVPTWALAEHWIAPCTFEFSNATCSKGILRRSLALRPQYYEDEISVSIAARASTASLTSGCFHRIPILRVSPRSDIERGTTSAVARLLGAIA